MNLYIINPITKTLAQYLLNHLRLYKGQVCDIIEINNGNIQDIKSVYLSKLTIGKLLYQISSKTIDYYIKYDLNDVIYYLVQIKQCKLEDIIYMICKFNATKCLQVLIDQGINVNIPDDGWTPLHEACYYNNVESAKLLLDNGAKKDIQDKWGSTPLHIACWKNRFVCVKLLLLNGANINIQNTDGLTPLQLAQQHNSTECIKLLYDL